LNGNYWESLKGLLLWVNTVFAFVLSQFLQVSRQHRVLGIFPAKRKYNSEALLTEHFHHFFVSLIFTLYFLTFFLALCHSCSGHVGRLDSYISRIFFFSSENILPLFRAKIFSSSCALFLRYKCAVFGSVSVRLIRWRHSWGPLFDLKMSLFARRRLHLRGISIIFSGQHFGAAGEILGLKIRLISNQLHQIFAQNGGKKTFFSG
jgi:hypothetical protein